MLTLPIFILIPTIAVLYLLRSNEAWDFFAVGVPFVALAWFVAAWIALRRMVRWQCPACRKGFFRDTRIRIPPLGQRFDFLELSRCANCAAPLKP